MSDKARRAGACLWPRDLLRLETAYWVRPAKLRALTGTALKK